MSAFNLLFVEPCSPKTLGISAISLVVSGATCVKGLVQPFWVTSIVVVLNTCTFCRKRLPKKSLLWTPTNRVSRMPTKSSQPAFYLDRSSIRFLTYVFFVRLACLKWTTHVLVTRAPTILLICPHCILTGHQSVSSPMPFCSTGPPKANGARLSNPNTHCSFYHSVFSLIFLYWPASSQ